MLTCVLLHFCFCCSLIPVLLAFLWLYLLKSVGLHQTGAMATLTESPVGVRTLNLQEVITCTKGSHFPPFPNSSPWNHFETYQILAKGSEWKENNTKNSWKLISGDHHSYSLPPRMPSSPLHQDGQNLTRPSYKCHPEATAFSRLSLSLCPNFPKCDTNGKDSTFKGFLQSWNAVSL